MATGLDPKIYNAGGGVKNPYATVNQGPNAGNKTDVRADGSYTLRNPSAPVSGGTPTPTPGTPTPGATVQGSGRTTYTGMDGNTYESGGGLPTTPVATGRAVGTPSPYQVGSTTSGSSAGVGGLGDDPRVTAANDAIKRFTGGEPNQGEIYTQNRQFAQGALDAINAAANREVASANEVGAGMNARVRAMNISGGLGGSDFGTAAAVGQEQKNKKVIDLIEAERAAKIQATLDNVADLTSQQYAERRKEYLSQLNTDLDQAKAARDYDRQQAQERLTSLAQSGVNIDKLKTAEPEVYNTLKTLFGGSDLELEGRFNAALPDNMKIKYTDKIIPDKSGNAVLLRYGVDPMTGSVKTSEYSLGQSYSLFTEQKQPIETNDGRLWRTNPDGSLTPLTQIDAKTQSEINANNALASQRRRTNEDGSTATTAKPISFTPTQKNMLIKNGGLTTSVISQLEKDIGQYGYTKVYNAQTDPKIKKAIEDAFSE